ncbi:LssY C-terminal domain-containing protein [Hyphomicrobium sp.]|uniref:LssY C-terminal domain-containing protein n=1 Tax=Hyphomicrobium sp. TaxID=82 RepID=UPI002E381AA1|nr:LssY C-terminal domain-containing protein [Hyphomicrobium sp.]HEX2841157.1 LssY C-terminal domain-containing protein [Hyphomicrobium sp.]
MSQEAPSKSRIWRLTQVLAILVGVYVLTAYVVLPALWFDYEHQPGLAGRNMVTTTRQGIPGDPLNVGVVGSKEQVAYAMNLAGWKPADAITLRSSIDIGLSVVLDRPYADAPVSNLYLDGRKQDLAFERPDGTSADRRHHVRFWHILDKGVEGHGVWLGSATFDRGVGVSHDTLQITHHIDPDIDRERAFVIASLKDANVVQQTYQVTGTGPTLNGRNGEGDRYYTDGEITIAVLDPNLDPKSEAREAVTPVAKHSRAQAIKHRIWTAILATARAVGIVPTEH